MCNSSGVDPSSHLDNQGGGELPARQVERINTIVNIDQGVKLDDQLYTRNDENALYEESIEKLPGYHKGNWNGELSNESSRVPDATPQGLRPQRDESTVSNNIANCPRIVDRGEGERLKLSDTSSIKETSPQRQILLMGDDVYDSNLAQ